MPAQKLANFDLRAVYEALDAQRQARGLTWAEAMREINCAIERFPVRSISRSTVARLRTKAVAEGDGVLQMLRWLNRPPETFMLGLGPEEVTPRLPDLLPHQVLRFDTRKLHAALDVQRIDRHLNWKQVGFEIGGVSPSSLTHLREGGRTGFPHVMRIIRWLDRPSTTFMRISNW